jgi:hypothetical protein
MAASALTDLSLRSKVERVMGDLISGVLGDL